MRRYIIKTLLQGDLSELKSAKAFAFYILKMIICVTGIIYFINQGNLINRISISFYFSAIALGTFVYAYIFILSSFMYNRKVVLFNMLPIMKKEIWIYIELDLLIEIYITKFLPLLIAISAVLVSNERITLYACIGELLKGFSIFIVFASLALIMVMHVAIGKRYRIVLDLFMSTMLFVGITYFENSIILDYGLAIILCCISFIVFNRHIENVMLKKKYTLKVSSGLLQREYIMFFSDKILVCNFIFSTVVSLILVISLVINEIHLNFMVAIMTMLPLLSVTTFSMYSYESERIKLICSLPLKKSVVFLNKYIVSLTITLSSTIIISATLLIGKVVGIRFCMLYIMLTVFICAEKILMDILHPCLEFSHTEELLRNSRKYKMFLVCTIGYIPVLLLDCGLDLWLLYLLGILLNGIIIRMLILRIKQAAV